MQLLLCYRLSRGALIQVGKPQRLGPTLQIISIKPFPGGCEHARDVQPLAATLFPSAPGGQLACGAVYQLFEGI